jgi:hypothetical protein
MSIKLDLSENITGYKEDLEKDLQTLETELNSISISLNIIPKPQINKIESLFSECENNVRKIVYRINSYVEVFTYFLRKIFFFQIL